MKHSTLRIIYALESPFRRISRLIARARFALYWGERAAGWTIDPSVMCNDVSGVTLGDSGRIGAGTDIRIEDNVSGTSHRGHVKLGSGVQIAGHSTFIAIGGLIDVAGCVYVGPHCHFGAYGRGITIGADTMIASHCTMVDTQHGYIDPDTPIKNQGFSSRGIVIGEDVWLGAGVAIMDGVNIGRGAVVGAGAVVTCNIPPLAVAVGVPAKVIKYRGPGPDRGGVSEPDV